jgi:hypothetical protein
MRLAGIFPWKTVFTNALRNDGAGCEKQSAGLSQLTFMETEPYCPNLVFQIAERKVDSDERISDPARVGIFSHGFRRSHEVVETSGDFPQRSTIV